METVMNQEKKHLRKRMLAKLVSLTENELRRRSKNAEEKISNLPLYKNAKTVMFYYPIFGEIDLKGTIRKAIPSKRVCLPVTDLAARQLKVLEIDDLDKSLVKGVFGIMEPKKGKEIDTKEIDVVIVPGLAFDYQRNRLGRGGGFYDRFLEKLLDSAKKIGIAFDFQIVKSLPVNLPKDQKVDLIVSDDSVV